MKSVKIDNYVLTYISVLVLFLVIYYLISNRCNCGNHVHPQQKELFFDTGEERDVVKVFGNSDGDDQGAFNQFLDGVIDIGKVNYMNIP